MKERWNVSTILSDTTYSSSTETRRRRRTLEEEHKWKQMKGGNESFLISNQKRDTKCK